MSNKLLIVCSSYCEECGGTKPLIESKESIPFQWKTGRHILEFQIEATLYKCSECGDEFNSFDEVERLHHNAIVMYALGLPIGSVDHDFNDGRIGERGLTE